MKNKIRENRGTIELILENCDSYEIPLAYIDYILFANYQKCFTNIAINAIAEIETYDNICILFEKEANEKVRSEYEKQDIKMLQFFDNLLKNEISITQININRVNKNNKKIEISNFYVPWEDGSNFSTNVYQRSRMIGNKLLLVIANEKKIDDEFFETVNDVIEQNSEEK